MTKLLVTVSFVTKALVNTELTEVKLVLLRCDTNALEEVKLVFNMLLTVSLVTLEFEIIALVIVALVLSKCDTTALVEVKLVLFKLVLI